MSRPKTSRTIAAEIERNYKQRRKQIEGSMAETTPGTTAHLNHIDALNELFRRYIRDRMERGLDSKNLGVATKPQFVFRSTFEHAPDPISAERQALNERYDKEFGFAPSEPEPEPELKRKKGKQ